MKTVRERRARKGIGGQIWGGGAVLMMKVRKGFRIAWRRREDRSDEKKAGE